MSRTELNITPIIEVQSTTDFGFAALGVSLWDNVNFGPSWDYIGVVFGLEPKPAPVTGQHRTQGLWWE